MTKKPDKSSKSIASLLLLLLLSVQQVRLKDSQKNGEADAEYPKGCPFLHCEKNDQCVIRKFWCKNPPCPSMLYCSKSRKESLKGPATCDYVRCSKGYICHVKVRHCRWEKCEQQIARCISEKEYYEGPASCAGFRCPSGRRCILRESFCIRPPCKLLKSCAKHNDARLWFDRCRSLGCPSEHECFLRRPDGKCSHPPCKHTPDCTITNEIESSSTEHCRGWICPKNQECSAQIQGSCDSKGFCKVKRYCHGSLTSPLNSTEYHGHLTSFLPKNSESRKEKEIYASENKEEDHVPITKTLAQIEKELILKDQEKLRKEMLKDTTTTTTTTARAQEKAITNAADGIENDVNFFREPHTKNSWMKKWQTFNEVPIDNSPMYNTATEKPIDINRMDTSLRSPLDKLIPTLISGSTWLDQLREKIGMNTIRVWANDAQKGRNYPQFQGWLQSVKEILGPTIYELWLEDVRAVTATNAAFQAWLPPPSSLRSVQELQRLLESTFEYNDEGTFKQTKFPKDQGRRLNTPPILAEGRYSIHDKWNILQNPEAFNLSLNTKLADKKSVFENTLRRDESDLQYVGDYYLGRNPTKEKERKIEWPFPHERDWSGPMQSIYNNESAISGISIFVPSTSEEEPKKRVGSLEKSIGNTDVFRIPSEYYSPPTPQFPTKNYEPYAKNFDDYGLSPYTLKNHGPGTKNDDSFGKQVISYGVDPFVSWSGNSPAAIESAGLLPKNTKANIAGIGDESIKLFQPSFNEVVQDYGYDPWLQGFFRANVNSTRLPAISENYIHRDVGATATGLWRNDSHVSRDKQDFLFIGNKVPPETSEERKKAKNLMEVLSHMTDQQKETQKELLQPHYQMFQSYSPYPPFFRDSRLATNTERPSQNVSISWKHRPNRDPSQKRFSSEELRAKSNEESWTGARNLFTPHRKLPISLYGVLRSGPVEDPRSTGYPLFYAYTPDNLVDDEFRLLAPYAAYYQQYAPRTDDYVEFYDRFHTDIDNAGPIVRKDNLEDILKHNYRSFLDGLVERNKHLAFTMIDTDGGRKRVTQIPDELLQSWQIHHRNFLTTLLRLLDKERFYHYGGNTEQSGKLEKSKQQYESVTSVPKDVEDKRPYVGLGILHANDVHEPKEQQNVLDDPTNLGIADQVNVSNNGRLQDALNLDFPRNVHDPIINIEPVVNSEKDSSPSFNPYDGESQETFAGLYERSHEAKTFPWQKIDNRTRSSGIFQQLNSSQGDDDGSGGSTRNNGGAELRVLDTSKDNVYADNEKYRGRLMFPLRSTAGNREFMEPRPILRKVETAPDGGGGGGVPHSKALLDPDPFRTEVVTTLRPNLEYALTTSKGIQEERHSTVQISEQEDNIYYKDDKDYNRFGYGREEDYQDKNHKFNETIHKDNTKSNVKRISDYDINYD